jgi:intraflagellar transport protein 56
VVDKDKTISIYVGCCYFFLGMYKEALEYARKGPTTKLQNRLLFHISHKLNDEVQLMSYHKNLEDITEDQVTGKLIHSCALHQFITSEDIFMKPLIFTKD